MNFFFQISLSILIISLNCQEYALFEFHDGPCTQTNLEKSVFIPIDTNLKPITDTYLYVVDWFDRHHRNFLHYLFPDEYWDDRENVDSIIFRQSGDGLSLYWEDCDDDSQQCSPAETNQITLGICSHENVDEKVHLRVRILSNFTDASGISEYATAEYSPNFFIKKYTKSGNCDQMGVADIFFIQNTFQCFEKNSGLAEHYYKQSEQVVVFNNDLFLVDYSDMTCGSYNAVEVSIVRGSSTCSHGSTLELFGTQMTEFPIEDFPVEEVGYFIQRSYVDGTADGSCLSNEPMDDVAIDYVQISSLFKLKMNYCYQRDTGHFLVTCEAALGCPIFLIFYFSSINVNCNPFVDVEQELDWIVEIEKCYYDPGHAPNQCTWNIFFVDCPEGYNMLTACETCLPNRYGKECNKWKCNGVFNNDSNVCSGNGYCSDTGECYCLLMSGVNCEELDVELLFTFIYVLVVPCCLLLFLIGFLVVFIIILCRNAKKRRARANLSIAFNERTNGIVETSGKIQNVTAGNPQKNIKNQSTNNVDELQPKKNLEVEIEHTQKTPGSEFNDFETPRSVVNDIETPGSEVNVITPKYVLLGSDKKKYKFFADHFTRENEKIMYENIEKIDKINVCGRENTLVKFVLFLSEEKKIPCLFSQTVSSFFQKYLVDGINENESDTETESSGESEEGEDEK